MKLLSKILSFGVSVVALFNFLILMYVGFYFVRKEIILYNLNKEAFQKLSVGKPLIDPFDLYWEVYQDRELYGKIGQYFLDDISFDKKGYKIAVYYNYPSGILVRGAKYQFNPCDSNRTIISIKR